MTKLAVPFPVNLELITAGLQWDAADNPAPLLLISHFMVVAEDTLLHLVLKHRFKIKSVMSKQRGRKQLNMVGGGIGKAQMIFNHFNYKLNSTCFH